MTTIAATMHTTLRAEGFSCPSCVGKIEKQLGHLPGVANVEVKFASGRVEVDHDPARTSPEALAEAVTALGYPARVSAF